MPPLPHKKRKADAILNSACDGGESGVKMKATRAIKRTRISKKKKSSSGENLFMKLPGELRNKIYGIILVGDKTVYIQRRGTHRAGLVQVYEGKPKCHTRRSKIPGILQVSQQIRQEAMSIYLGDNNVAFQISTRRLDEGAMGWFRKLHAANLLQPREQNFKIISQDDRLPWIHLPSYEPLLRFIYDIDLGFADQTAHEEFWVARFQPEAGPYFYLSTALRFRVKLVRWAVAQQWHDKSVTSPKESFNERFSAVLKTIYK